MQKNDKKKEVKISTPEEIREYAMKAAKIFSKDSK